MEENKSLFDLRVDDRAYNNLSEASRWAKFFAIAILISMGIFFLFVIAFSSRISQIFSGMEGADLTVIFIIVFIILGAIVGTLMYFLIRGANLIRKGLQYNDQAVFNDGLASLRNYFVMYGVLTVISFFFSLINLF